MSLRLLEVHKAVLDTFSASLAPIKVYDHVPADAAMPFVDLSAHQALPNPPERPLNLDPVAVHTMFLTVWSDYRGQKQVLDILHRIDEALNNASLTLEAGTAVLCQVSSLDCRLDADGATYQGAATLRLLAI